MDRIMNNIVTIYDAEHSTQKYTLHRIGGEMVNMFASIVVNPGFEPRSGQTKDYTTGICIFVDETQH